MVIHSWSFVKFVVIWFKGTEPWPCSSPEAPKLLRHLEATCFPLECKTTRTKIGIGVATGSDRVFITPQNPNIEPDRILQNTFSACAGGCRWVINLFTHPIMTLTVQELARLIDLSSVRAECDETEIRDLAATARRLGVICAFALPCYTRLLKSLLADAPDVGIGGVVGFPSGAHTTSIKVAEARQQLADGATELDMVINVGQLRSGNHQAVREDIRAVVTAAGATPLKVILECHWLTAEQIRIGSELCVEAGAAWVKTGTGWAPTGATLENLTIMRDAVGGRAGIKASGGVRDLATLVAMYRIGVRRFGIGTANGIRILEDCAALPGGVVNVS